MELVLDRELVSHIREIYKKGERVMLIRMNGEPQMEKGLKGTIKKVDDAGQIHVSWENGSSLALVLDEDDFIKI